MDSTLILRMRLQTFPHLKSHDSKDNDGSKYGGRTVSESHNQGVPVVKYLIEMFVMELADNDGYHV